MRRSALASLIAAATFALLAFNATAASFDCAEASRPIDKMICADPALSKADEDLASAYAAALAASLDAAGLRNEQREWLVHRDRVTAPGNLSHLYQERIAALVRAAEGWRGLRREFVAELIAGDCFVTPEADADLKCRVEEAGKVGGDPSLSYQLQGFFDQELRVDGGAVIFAAAPGDVKMLRPVLTAFGDTAHYAQPRLIRSAAATLLHIPGHMEGTGNFNVEFLYALLNGAWRPVDTESWQREMSRRLPKDLYAAKGVYPDYRTMRATTPLWRKDHDGNCCPTGGRALILLGLKGATLTLEEIHVRRGEKAAEE